VFRIVQGGDNERVRNTTVTSARRLRDIRSAPTASRSRYLKGMTIGIVATAAVICGIYLALVAIGVVEHFSGLALGSAALLSIPGGAVLGLLIASDADPADD